MYYYIVYWKFYVATEKNLRSPKNLFLIYSNDSSKRAKWHVCFISSDSVEQDLSILAIKRWDS